LPHTGPPESADELEASVRLDEVLGSVPGLDVDASAVEDPSSSVSEDPVVAFVAVAVALVSVTTPLVDGWRTCPSAHADVTTTRARA
jgi:hypothetical protein